MGTSALLPGADYTPIRQMLCQDSVEFCKRMRDVRPRAGNGHLVSRQRLRSPPTPSPAQEICMPAERFDFRNAEGQQLAALLDRPEGEIRAVALFAHCFTCGKQN